MAMVALKLLGSGTLANLESNLRHCFACFRIFVFVSSFFVTLSLKGK